MTSTYEASPAELTARLIEAAKRRAEREEWAIYEDENRRQLEALRPKPITHGLSGYKRGCKCDECRSAVMEYQRAYRARKPKTSKVSNVKGRGREVKEWMHGSLTGYSYGCRCDECTEAHRVAKPKSGTKHGTEYGYRQGCRCRSCMKASRDARSRRAGREVKSRRTVPLAEHGTRKRYQQGCKCLTCKRANALFVREYRARRNHAEVSNTRQDTATQES